MQRNLDLSSIQNRDLVATDALTYLYQEELYKFGSPLVVVLAREWHTYSDEDRLVLTRLLSAVKVGSDAATILTRPSVKVEELAVYSPASVLVFGSEISPDFPRCEQIKTNGFKLMRADDLHLLDEPKKKELWAALRRMFGVK